MKVIIPMAGLGSRMRPHTFSQPKPLLNVAGKPMLDYLIDRLEMLHPEEYIFIVGYLGEQIQDYITATYDFKARFVVQDELVGQAHAIYLAREYLGGPVITLFSDTLFEGDLSIINSTDADAIAFTMEVDDPRRFGVVELDNSGYVRRFIEKPDSLENKTAVIGLYYIHDSLAMLRAIEKQMARKQMTRGEFFLTDSFQIMVEEGARFVTQTVDMWLDTGKTEAVLEANRRLLESGRDNSEKLAVPPGVAILPPVNIHPSAVLERSVIGPHVTIGEGCEIRNSSIRNSIIDAGAQVKNLVLADSLVGRNTLSHGGCHILNIGEQSSIDLS
nr:NTP transferase domain-containing protein [Anaerolineae bacterium]